MPFNNPSGYNTWFNHLNKPKKPFGSGSPTQQPQVTNPLDQLQANAPNIEELAAQLGYISNPAQPGTYKKGNTPNLPVGAYAGAVGGSNDVLTAQQIQQQAGGQGGAMAQLAQALGIDISNLSAEANQKADQFQGVIGGLEGMLGGLGNKFQEQAAGSAAKLDARAKEMDALGAKQLADFNAQSGKNMADITARIDQANATANDAVETFRGFVNEYQDRSAQDASAMAYSIRSQAQDQMMQINAGLNPDGTVMTSTERAAAQAELGGQVNDQVQAAITPMLSRANEVKAQLGLSLAGLQMGESQQQLAGAQTLGQLGVENQRSFLQAQEGQRQMAQVATGLITFSEQLQSSALLNAVSLEMNGRTALAELINSAPSRSVSLFSGLAALLAAGSAPGANKLPAFNFSQVGV